MSNQTDIEDKSQQKSQMDKMKQYFKIINSCKTMTFCDNVMKECCYLFRDENFGNKLDSNKYLIAFKNGVYDLKNNIFRAGKPEDFLSKCMNITWDDYKLDDKRVLAVENFLEKVFPDKSLRRFFVDTMSDVFEGGNKKKTVIS